MICSYVLWPVAVVMGVEIIDCRKVAQLIGIKTFLNEFIAYQELGQFIDNRRLFYEHVANNGSWYERGDDIYLVGGEYKQISEMNDTILTNGFITVNVFLFNN